ncbi:hypothetical protein QZH41_005510 [Actinostola sp. cb2023]|nr:hypothetical protein QZH41_005510 [Actinostola sp. cb2023]
MPRHPNPSLCLVKAIESYVATSREMGIKLSRGYLFRPANPNGNVVDRPFSSPAAEARLKLYLRGASIDNGETLHSFRAGCALSLTFAGSTLGDVMSHIGWSSPTTASSYMKLASVLQAGVPSDLLAQDRPESGTQSHCD